MSSAKNPLGWPRKVSHQGFSLKVYRIKQKSAKGGFQYSVAWPTPAGRQRKSFVDEKAALEYAHRVAVTLSEGHRATAQMTQADYQELCAARELAGANFLPIIERNRAAHRLAKEMTVNEAVATYFKARRTDGIQVHRGPAQTFYPGTNVLWPTFSQVFGTRLLADITANELADWLSHFEHPITRNTHRKRLVALWRWCRKRGYLPDEITTAAERTDSAKEPPGKIEIIGAKPLRRIFHAVAQKDPRVIPALALSAFCGMRRNEVHGQHWEDIDIRRNFLRVTAAKPGTPARRQVPITPTARAWLSPHIQEKGKLCSTDFLDYAKTISRAIGIHIPKNALRHTWISAQAELTGDLPRIALDAGTSVDIIHKHYRQLLTREEAEAWFAVLPSTRSPMA